MASSKEGADSAARPTSSMTFQRVRKLLITQEDSKYVHKTLAALSLLHGAYAAYRFVSSGYVAAGFDTADDRMDLYLYLVHLALNVSPLLVFNRIPMRIHSVESAVLFKQYVLHRAVFEASLFHTLWQCSNVRAGPPESWLAADLAATATTMVLAEVVTHSCPTGLGTSVRNMTPDSIAGPVPPWLWRKLLAFSIVFGTTYYPLWRTWTIHLGQWTRRGAQLEFMSVICLSIGSELLSFGATLKRKQIVPNPCYFGFIYSIFVGTNMVLKFAVLFSHGLAIQMLVATGVCVLIRFSIPRTSNLAMNIAAKAVPAMLFILLLRKC